MLIFGRRTGCTINNFDTRGIFYYGANSTFNEEESLNANQLTSDDVIAILAVRDDPNALLKIAIRVLERMKGDIALVCGPFLTGTMRTPRENLRRLSRVIASLRRQGVSVFDQTVFWSEFYKIQTAKHPRDGNFIHRQFDLPILTSKRVKTIYFTLEWRRSAGARWYRAQAIKLGIPIRIVQPAMQKAAVE
jgi:hypothetical protein